MRFDSLSKDRVLRVLRREPFALRENVRSVYLMGSLVENPAGRHTDLDILMEVQPRRGWSTQDLREHYKGTKVTLNGLPLDVHFTYDMDEEPWPKRRLR